MADGGKRAGEPRASGRVAPRTPGGRGDFRLIVICQQSIPSRALRSARVRFPLTRSPMKLASNLQEQVASHLRRRILSGQLLPDTPLREQTLAEEFRKRGVSPEELSLEYAVLGAEPWTEAIRKQVDEGLGVKSTNIYGLSEIIGPGVSNECVEERQGSHIWEDHFLPEVVDPDTGEPLPEGKVGVLVFTTLTKEAMPLLRYWTGDLTFLTYEACTCGRTHVRMGPILGRTDDMLIIRGVNVYPTQVEAVLLAIPEVEPYYQIVVRREGTLDEAELKVEVSEPFFREIGREVLSDEVVEADHRLHALRERIARKIKDNVSVTLKVTLLPPGQAPRSEGGKLRRVLDLRK